jgi:hydrogenase maturation protein HypF
VRGLVQGVGFRPFVYVTASELELAGSVSNDGTGVVVEVEGDPVMVREMGARLSGDAPPLAIVESVEWTDLRPVGGTGFRIDDSSRGGQVRTLASPDVATCADCLRELADPSDRRFRHPFITCTNCGPRFSIITALPYDRPSTTMTGFPMCEACAAEYADPADRRFHAQPIACPDCGPRLELLARDGTATYTEAALREARRRLARGEILAVKGIGGYHLACDASNESVVAELRRRKRRGDKPFALLVRDLEAVRRLAYVDELEANLLTGPRKPILLLNKRSSRPGARPPLAPSVAPGVPDVGIMLPYTPLHTLLLGLDGDEPGAAELVLTSGNLGGEPIVSDDDEALERLAPLVDGWLRHDRPIAVACDDSVTRVVDGEELPVRRSRGYAPLPVALPVGVRPTLAVGADLKNTHCLASGRYAWLSQHVGDMDDLATLRTFGTAERHLERLTGVEPVTLVADAHPAYRSTRWADANAAGRPAVRVQHHHAHIASVMGEHGLDGQGKVIGIAFDGTGYGTDGAIWGGEVLIANYRGFRRFAHLGYVPLAGGDASVERPYRMALAHLAAAEVGWDMELAPVRTCPEDELRVLRHQLRTGLGCVPTSSMGRLFDAVASIAGVRQTVDYEAQAAIELEGLARAAPEDGPAYHFTLDEDQAGGGLVAGAAPVVRAAARDSRAGAPGDVISARFHRGVARLVLDLARRARAETGLRSVALGGGVFQNVVLLAWGGAALRADGFTVLRPTRLPPNDGGLALGQVLVGSEL